MTDNPFRYGELVSGQFFTNRERELAELESDLGSGQNIVVISPRRYGKTSLILMVIERLRKQGVLVAYLDLFGVPSKAALVQRLAKSLHAGFLSPARQRLQAVVDAFKGLSVTPRLSLGPDGTPTLELMPAGTEADHDRDLEVLFELPAKIARERRARVAIVIDEFQEILSIGTELPGLMRSVFQHQPEVAHVFLGSRFHLMNDLFNKVAEPLYKSAKPVPLRPLDRADFAAFIRERFGATGMAIGPEALDRTLGITACHPNDTQQLAHFTWSLCKATDQEPTLAAVETALTRVIAAEDAHYTAIWEGLSQGQKAVLIALAKAGGDVFGERYRRENLLGPASSVQGALSRLKAKELVHCREGNEYEIADTFLRYWIRQVVSKDAW